MSIKNSMNDKHEPRRTTNNRDSKLSLPVRSHNLPSRRSLASKQSAPEPKDYTHTKESLGFSDIPTSDSGDDSLRRVFGTWLTQSFHLNHPDNKLRHVYQFIHQKKYRSWAEDLKWALKADMDDDDARPAQKKQAVSPPRVASIPPKQQWGAPPAASHQATQQDNVAKSIEINIAFGELPKIPPIKKLFKSFIAFTARRRYLSITLALVIVIGSAVTTTSFLNQKNTDGNSGEFSQESIEQQAPDFATLLPNGTDVTDLGGWKRVSPPKAAPVFAYADKVDNVSIAVSQQVLPDDFKSGTEKKMAELAKSFSATDKLTTKDDVVVYVGTSAKGPQSAILAKDGLLVLIKANAKISNESWTQYIESLISPVPHY